MESPQIYCRSALGDKISDYEDLWSQEAFNPPLGRGPGMTSFGMVNKQRPDVLPETRKLHF